ncbi:peptidase inhibitor family I36 protein [Kitasatospora sp. NPDC004799]|uniref:peptidase inhibitor family I36 protein n=1 Tax=Kitasatospora sp. NPDC004799 TaxID=3154460 RepID=UPI00339DE4FB
MSKFRTMAACLSMAAGFAVAAPIPAAVAAPAATGYNRCGSGQFCLFQHVDGQGGYVALTGSTPSLVGLNFNDIASSVRNNTGATWSVYTDINYGGRCLTISHNYTGNLTQYAGMNDSVSSARPGGC